MNSVAQIKRIRERTRGRVIRILNVCGGHERTVAFAGLRNALIDCVDLIPGPGCPVCVCPDETIRGVIEWGLNTGGVIVTFGDMLRVPISRPINGIRSLEQARQHNVSVVAISSPLEIAKISKRYSDRPIVFLAIGFETTMAPVAALIKNGLPENVRIELAGRRTAPIVKFLLEDNQIEFDALIAPGHVAAIMGAAEWQFVVDQYSLPVVVSGFTPEDLVAAIACAVDAVIDNRNRLLNAYSAVVADNANPTAMQLFNDVFAIRDAPWRGIGVVPNSGFYFAENWRSFNAGLTDRYDANRENVMPKACECAHVMLGRIKPNQCRIYGNACTPLQPIGPCMVSDEGACRIWWSTGIQSGVTRSSATQFVSTIEN